MNIYKLLFIIAMSTQIFTLNAMADEKKRELTAAFKAMRVILSDDAQALQEINALQQEADRLVSNLEYGPSAEFQKRFEDITHRLEQVPSEFYDKEEVATQLVKIFLDDTVTEEQIDQQKAKMDNIRDLILFRSLFKKASQEERQAPEFQEKEGLAQKKMVELVEKCMGSDRSVQWICQTMTLSEIQAYETNPTHLDYAMQIIALQHRYKHGLSEEEKTISLQDLVRLHHDKKSELTDNAFEAEIMHNAQRNMRRTLGGE